MVLSLKKISFGVQFYKNRRVGFIAIVMNQVYKSLRGADFLTSPQLFYPKCVKCYSDSKYNTYKPIQ